MHSIMANERTRQIEGVNARTDMLDGRQDHDKGGEVVRTDIMKSGQNVRSGIYRTKSGKICQGPESLGIDLQ